MAKWWTRFALSLHLTTPFCYRPWHWILAIPWPGRRRGGQGMAAIQSQGSEHTHTSLILY